MRLKSLTGAQRKYLRGLAHGLKPLAHVGRAGLSDPFLAELDEALGRHELVKVRFVELKDRKREACAEIGERLSCEHIGSIGHVAMFYRPAADPEERAIRLPTAAHR